MRSITSEPRLNAAAAFLFASAAAFAARGQEVQIGPGHFDQYVVNDNQSYRVVDGTDIVPPENNSVLSTGPDNSFAQLRYWGTDGVALAGGPVFRMDGGIIKGGDARALTYADTRGGHGIRAGAGTSLEFFAGLVTGGDAFNTAMSTNDGYPGGALLMKGSQATIYGGTFVGGTNYPYFNSIPAQPFQGESVYVVENSQLSIRGGSFSGWIAMAHRGSSITVYGSGFSGFNPAAYHNTLTGKYADGTDFSIPLELRPRSYVTTQTADSITFLFNTPEPSSLLLGGIAIVAAAAISRRDRSR